MVMGSFIFAITGPHIARDECSGSLGANVTPTGRRRSHRGHAYTGSAGAEREVVYTDTIEACGRGTLSHMR